jgi:hypothetical protein
VCRHDIFQTASGTNVTDMSEIAVSSIGIAVGLLFVMASHHTTQTTWFG